MSNELFTLTRDLCFIDDVPTWAKIAFQNNLIRYDAKIDKVKINTLDGDVIVNWGDMISINDNNDLFKIEK